MFMKKPRHRIFDYTPRFYKPEQDEKERRKRKLGFQRQRKILRHKRSPILWLLLIILVIYIYLKFTGVV
jgi:ATP/ADP translocase